MSVTITPTSSRSSQFKVPLTSQAPLGSGAFYKVAEPLNPGTVLDTTDSYKRFLNDASAEKYCIIYDKLYTGMDTRMALDIEVISGQGNVDNRHVAAHTFNELAKNQKPKISKRSITAADWDLILTSNKLVKLA